MENNSNISKTKNSSHKNSNHKNNNHKNNNHKNNNYKNSPRIAVLKCIPAILMLIFIFAMSAKNAEESSEESNTVTQVIVNVASFMDLVPSNLDEAVLDNIDNVVRELAHFTEYLVLGLTLGMAVSGLNISMEKKRRYLWLLVFAVCYAISDEIHQFYVPGRCFQIQDIIVDSLGACAGILLYAHMASPREQSFPED
ncbi:MAG: VanZ family protein [Lachnospiraceae bacterium]|nr:VanZ family protein [Lachnospiraceae bacterium]